MHIIQTDETPILVEIDGRVYPLRPRTTRAMRRFDKAGRLRDPGHRGRARLRAMLGRRAARVALGRGASLDRLEALAAGVRDAWLSRRDSARRQRLERTARETQAALAPLTEALDRLEALYGQLIQGRPT